jgi:MFS family permease
VTPSAAVGWVFSVSGFLTASWLSRLPAVRDALSLSPGRLGTVLLALSFGSVLALPSSGPVVHRLGTARTVLAAATVASVMLVLVGLGGSGQLGGVRLVAPALFGLGVGVGVWDVAMNVEAAEVERSVARAGRGGRRATRGAPDGGCRGLLLDRRGRGATVPASAGRRRLGPRRPRLIGR